MELGKENQVFTGDELGASIGQRIVLTCSRDISFCGLSHSIHTVDQQKGLLLVTDQETNLSVWCPIEHIKEITIIPI